jgi:hypothetical protein
MKRDLARTTAYNKAVVSAGVKKALEVTTA